MAMPAARTDWTVELLDELPDDGNRYELLDGVLLVTPAPSDVHQLVASERTTPDARTVAVWPRRATSAMLYTHMLRWQPEGMAAVLSIDLSEFFVTALC